MQQQAKPPFKNILALDLGSSLGWAFAQDGVIRASGTRQLKQPDDLPGIALFPADLLP